MEWLNKAVEAYTEAHTTAETELLQELVRHSARELTYTDMISGRQTGQLLKCLIQIGGARRVLEVGTFTGYSAICMADALPEGGELITLEMNERYREISSRYFSREPYRNKIRQIIGPALESIDRIEGEVDLVFLDADKARYPEYYRKLKPLLKNRGVLVVDNVLWNGSVLRPDDKKSEAIDQLNRQIHEDPDFENLMLPLRDGVTVATKIR